MIRTWDEADDLVLFPSPASHARVRRHVVEQGWVAERQHEVRHPRQLRAAGDRARERAREDGRCRGQDDRQCFCHIEVCNAINGQLAMPPASGEMDVQISLLECLIPARRQGRGEEMRAVAEDAPAGPVGPIPVPALEPRLQVGGQRASRTERAQHGAPCGICEICKGFCRGKNEFLELRGRGEERPAGREHLLEKREHNVKVVLRGSGQLEYQEEKLKTHLQARL